jgi:hypothetical protein
MPSLPWVFGAGILLLAAATLAIPARSVQVRPSKRRIQWIKGLAALRAVVSSVLAFLAAWAVLDTSAGASMRWTLTFAAACGVLMVVFNALVAVWLLSPFVGADPGLDVVASGLRGTIRGYGWSRLEVTTHAGWTAHLPYATIVLRPLIICRHDGPQPIELRFRNERWGDAELQFLHQAAVLSPYRDPSVPVSVSRRARVATVRLGLAQRATQQRMRIHLEGALARFRDVSSLTGRDPP